MRLILDIWRYARLASKQPTSSALLPEYGTIFYCKRDNDFGFCSVEANRIVFSFTGSNDLRDWVENAEAFPITTDYIHCGFWNAWLDFQGFVFETVQKFPGRAIFITGYSRGAALATLAARAIAHNNGAACSLFTFGGPRVGGKAFREEFDIMPINYTRVVHGFDIVADLPPENLGYRHCGKLLELPEPFYHKWFCRVRDHLESNYDKALQKRFNYEC